MKNLVSIIMPSYNTAKYIAETIQSVIDQTYTTWELIIVDDCSTDNTDDVVAAFLNKEQRIRYLKNKKNCGAAISRNRAVREAKGKWIAFLDSDDIWMPEKLKLQLDFMKKYDIAFSYTNYCEIDEESCLIGKMITGPKKITRTGMYNYCWPGCLTVMYDAEKIGEIQIKDIKKNNDYAMWLKVCQRANCYLLDENLAKYRKRSGSISNHSYMELIKWHYHLFRDAEENNSVVSVIYTIRNLFFGLWKKFRYVKGDK